MPYTEHWVALIGPLTGQKIVTIERGCMHDHIYTAIIIILSFGNSQPIISELLYHIALRLHSMDSLNTTTYQWHKLI